MARADWRSAALYEHLRALDAPGIAWEFLSRNPELKEDNRKLEALSRNRVLTANELDSFAQRWGLRFRQVRTGYRRSPAAVDVGESAKRDCDKARSPRSDKPEPQS
jgi:hypothetical protein